MRSPTGTGLILTALTATLAALLFPIWSYADRSGTGLDTLNAQTVPTRFGPLSALDRDFVRRVRLAGLWELPAGQQAQDRGTTEAVGTAGRHLVEGHAFLDARVREVAVQLGLELPNQPDVQQRKWLAELSAAKGAEYDEKFANLLRLAHGKVFAVVAQVRASTRNSLVRGLADDANATVLDHIRVLEATGLVDFDAVATGTATTGPDPAPGTAPPGGPAGGPVRGPAPVTPSPSFGLPPPASRAPEDDGAGDREEGPEGGAESGRR